MGSLFVYRKNSSAERIQAASQVFRQQSFGDCIKMEIHENFEALVSGTQESRQPLHYRSPDGHAVAIAGTLIYRGAIGQSCLPQLLDDLVAGCFHKESAHGAFAIVYSDGKELKTITDWLGLLPCYHDPALNVWSTTFLSVCVYSQARQINLQAVFEYVIQGTTYGSSTLLKGVVRQSPNQWLSLGSGRHEIHLCPLSNVVPDENQNVDQAAEKALASLGGMFDLIKSCFGERVDSALSGGFDSRLILAMLWSRSIRPRLHVYGHQTDPDVRVAKEISASLRLALDHIDKGLKPGTDADESVHQNFLRFDGYPIDGIFDNGSDLATRRGRVSGDYVALNGGGGEIFRNFFYLPDRSFRLRELLWTFYSRFDPRNFRSAFLGGEYLDRLGQKLLSELTLSTEELDRTSVERAYIVFRLRYWMSRSTGINARIGPVLMPLVGLEAARTALAVPMRFKNHGTLQAQMIRQVAPSLAKFETDTGLDLEHGPTLRQRFLYHLNIHKPPRVRRYSYLVKNRLLKRRVDPVRPNCVLPGKPQYVTSLFDVERVKDPEWLSRIWTLEYLFRFLRVSG